MERYNKAPSRPNRRKQQNASDGFGHLLLFYILPFIVFNGILFFCVTARPKAVLTVADTNDYLTTEATLKVKSFFPLKSVTFTLDSQELQAVKDKNRTYVIPLTENGVLEAQLVNLNGMSSTLFEHVNILDDNPPTIENASIEDGIVTLTINDSQSGVNFNSIYALNSKNEQVEPLAADRNTNTLSFEMDSNGLYVFAQDKAGKEVRGTFTSHKEGGVEMLQGNVDDEGTVADDSQVSVE